MYKFGQGNQGEAEAKLLGFREDARLLDNQRRASGRARAPRATKLAALAIKAYDDARALGLSRDRQDELSDLMSRLEAISYSGQEVSERAEAEVHQAIRAALEVQ